MLTLVTFADASEARLEPAWALMIEANCDPSCSRLTRLATGVLASKKAVQFAVTSWLAAPPADDVAVADGVAAGVDAFGAELPHAATPTPSAQASRISGNFQEALIRTILQPFVSRREDLAARTGWAGLTTCLGWRLSERPQGRGPSGELVEHRSRRC